MAEGEGARSRWIGLGSSSAFAVKAVGPPNTDSSNSRSNSSSSRAPVARLKLIQLEIKNRLIQRDDVTRGAGSIYLFVLLKTALLESLCQAA